MSTPYTARDTPPRPSRPNTARFDVELADHRHLMPLLTFAHGDAEVDRLVVAQRDLVDA
jgi:hypothetical protein